MGVGSQGKALRGESSSVSDQILERDCAVAPQGSSERRRMVATKISITCPKCECDFEGDNSETEHICPECGMEVESATV